MTVDTAAALKSVDHRDHYPAALAAVDRTAVPSKNVQAIRLLRAGKTTAAVAAQLEIPEEPVDLVRRHFRIPLLPDDSAG